MTSNRPYMVRALYEWILDNQMTPYLVVAATDPAVVVPEQYVQDGQIVLNIGPGAVRNLMLGNDSINFGARFGGVAMEVEIPVFAVLGIYARENGRIMLFPDEGPVTSEAETGADEPRSLQSVPLKDRQDPQPPQDQPPRQRPTLKVVK